ncbi:hypothetical protein GCM10007874_08130 [Labrys miyagiensis]|uniref:Transposase n=1 Tax=Labrys miyagiensis TaxID=346912 RepID=A0ABQ6CDQ3_9HYPH|nr:hypothetical protein GCM10007874_08130 [Labrys miyagiensis]
MAWRECRFDTASGEIAQYKVIRRVAEPPYEPRGSPETRDGGKGRRDITTESLGAMQHLPLARRQRLINVDKFVDGNGAEAQN